MQEDIEERTVRLTITSTKMTVRTLINGIKMYLRHRKNKQLPGDKIQGKQSIEELVKQDQGVTSMVIGDAVGLALKGIVYLKGKKAKKYRHGQEFGSARWGNEKNPLFSVAEFVAMSWSWIPLVMRKRRFSLL